MRPAWTCAYSVASAGRLDSSQKHPLHESLISASLQFVVWIGEGRFSIYLPQPGAQIPPPTQGHLIKHPPPLKAKRLAARLSLVPGTPEPACEGNARIQASLDRSPLGGSGDLS